MKKAVLLILSVLVCALGLYSCSVLGVRINDKHFPDWRLMSSVRRVDVNENGYLSKEELEAAKNLSILGPCSDLTGIEYLTNLETLTLVYGCSDLSGIDNLTNLKTFRISEQCPDLSVLKNLTNLETIEIHDCVFNETFVLDSEISAANLEFRCCVFEKGILINNNSVKKATFEYCAAIGDVVFSDCDGLNSFNAEFRPDDKDLISCLDDLLDREYLEALQEKSCSIDLSGCENLDRVRVYNTGVIDSIDLSDCSMLAEISLIDWRDKSDKITLNISGCPNIVSAHLGLRCLKELDISGCTNLISVTEQTPSDKDWCLEYENEDVDFYCSNEKLVLIK